MNAVILTLGTQGDVQPFVALALGLKAVGHDVTVATSLDFRDFVEGRGLRFAPLRADFQALARSDAGRAVIAGKAMGAWKELKETIGPMMARVLEDCWVAAQGADVLVHHAKVLGVTDIAERLEIPAFVGPLMPLLVPTRAFPLPMLPVRSLGGTGNRLSYAPIRLMTLPFRRMLTRWRRDVLGLSPRPRFDDPFSLRGRPIPVLHAYSPALIPRPDDWGPHVAVTGFWFLNRPTNWEPTPDLVRFLDDGPPPVYVGFGSMPGSDPAAATRLVLEALADSGHRGLIATGWGGLGGLELPETVRAVESVPHDWLFPRVAAVVHHGGAGTTAAGLRAGRPSVICPHFADQPFWGRLVARHGASPPPIPRKKLTVGRLAAAIRAATGDPSIRHCAEAIGEAIRREDGVGTAVRWIRENLDSTPMVRS